ncbi:MAG: polysaccharide biosynthesis/export family protein [Paracoccaceae bacterium]
MATRMDMRALAVAVLLGLGGCGIVYTSPGVSEGTIFGGAVDDLDVSVVPLTFESTAAANLTAYVPSRLPLGLQPDAYRQVSANTGARATPRLPSLPAPPSRPNARPGFIPDNMPPAEAPRPYEIGIADVLLLSVNASSASIEQLPGLISAQSKRQGFVVQDDGAIAIPDAGRVRVAGMTMQDAEAAIFQALVSAGIDPSFSLEIAEFNSQRVSVGGRVNSPLLVPITLKPLYLHEAVDSAGGLSVSDARVSKIQLFRDGRTYQVSVRRFQNDPSVRQISLRDGDSVFVVSDFEEERARARFQEQIQLRQQQQSQVQFQLQANLTNAQISAQIASNQLNRLNAERDAFMQRVELGAVKRDYAYLAGEVVVPQRVELPFENKAVLADVLFNNRGININFGDYGEIYVLRRSTNPEELSRVTAYHLDADNAVNLSLASTFEVHAGDIVFVAEQPVTAWNRLLTQIFPSLLGTGLNAVTQF